ncbi:adhesion G protein-coupled receptor E3-like [Electrophorus electricus]|uniref:adhesion G protein-coupled receptor E3-like n=1 Tax=Electrophorus electricus TaxID=8005 RepID=UPI0015D01DB0|nr:adhesion G protein-coupled receptor E3-like [Electrophorus electricus]
MNDNNLQDGWYKFTGIGGDRIVYYCPHISLSSPSNELLNSSRSFQSSSAFHLYTCDINTPQLLHCGGALVLYYLTKNKGMYITCHSSCSASSCGEYAQCNPVDGSCVCNSGFSIPEGFLPTGDSYGYSIITPSEECKNFTAECAEEFLENIQNMTVQELPHKTVEKYLAYMVENCTNLLENTDTGQNVLISYGNAILKATEKLVSTLVKHTETYYVSNITFQTLEAEVFVVGPKASLSEITLNTSNAYMDIDLIGISKNNNGSAAVAFISYSNMLSFLKPSFFNTTNNTVKTMMSTVVSVTLPKTNNTHLTEPVNFTLKHIVELDPEGFLSCVYWKETEWVVDGCIIIQSNSNQTVCSCIHLSTFALIMQTNPGKVQRDELDLLELLNKVAMSVGLVFLSLALLTFALCPRSQTVTNIALINLCTSLLLAHIIFLLIQHFLHTIKLYQLMCTALAGVLHFFFLSAFVWMFLDAVLLFIAMRNLSRIRSKQEEVLNWKCLIIIGYVIPLVIVGVSAGLFLDGYGSEQCWLKKDGEFLWSFLGPVCFVLTSNGIIFIIIVASFTYTLKHRDSEILQMNQNRATKKLIKSVTLKIMAQSVILGCPWILGFFTRGNEVVEILFLVLNSQQGTFIFLVHCVFNQEVRQQYRKWLKVFCSCKSTTVTHVQKTFAGSLAAHSN